VEVGWLSSDLSYADMTFVPRWPFQRLSTIWICGKKALTNASSLILELPTSKTMLNEFLIPINYPVSDSLQ
jgi:hypothetical protein